MSEFEIHYFTDKVFVHHWPKNSPQWSDSLQKKLDTSINKNSIIAYDYHNFKKVELPEEWILKINVLEGKIS